MSTYKAYCTTPRFPSWLGNGTSRRANFIGGGVPGAPATRPGFCIGAALFDEVDDRKAALPARYGMSAAAGFTIHAVSSEDTTRFLGGGARPRSAIEAADLVVDNILATQVKKIRTERRGEGPAKWRWQEKSRNCDVVERNMPRQPAD